MIDSPLANSVICALCSVSSHLGQGDLNRYAPSAGFDPFQSTQARSQTRRSTRSGAKAASQRSLKNSIYHLSDTCGGDSLTRVGRPDIADPITVFEESGHVIAHHCCAAWSSGVAPRTSSVKSNIAPLQYHTTEGNGTNIILVGVDRAVLSSLSRKCKYCQNYGASVKCKVDNCQSWYHYPCAVASGAFQDAHSCSILCTPEHRHEADKISSNSACVLCEIIGDLSDLLFCTHCGYHYHARCLSESLTVTGEVRAGWQCPNCKNCQQCHQSHDDSQMIICEICDKGWHTYCLEPIMTTIPKDGWSCNNCRTCIDCGNKIRLSRSNSTSPNDKDLVCKDCQRHRSKDECIMCGKDTTLTNEDAPIIKCVKCAFNVHEDCELDKVNSFEIATVIMNQY